jgi:hypothetical protein
MREVGEWVSPYRQMEGISSDVTIFLKIIVYFIKN